MQPLSGRWRQRTVSPMTVAVGDGNVHDADFRSRSFQLSHELRWWRRRRWRWNGRRRRRFPSHSRWSSRQYFRRVTSTDSARRQRRPPAAWHDLLARSLARRVSAVRSSTTDRRTDGRRKNIFKNTDGGDCRPRWRPPVSPRAVTPTVSHPPDTHAVSMTIVYCSSHARPTRLCVRVCTTL